MRFSILTITAFFLGASMAVPAAPAAEASGALQLTDKQHAALENLNAQGICISGDACDKRGCCEYKTRNPLGPALGNCKC
ncbi:hypothetical protein ASPVEDRAFT_37396 [Aspergillus versicolor CBS 583.65]|uniref:Invertebrate defensins family profile domain-containing protein n=1 Tax=Aspergillus versicolor CBS 583.65 TaxID=1036611 RepID=A0A1L9P920_ASPVE|nr:uncharacterized protein ASPVEDRAFT_37396 [Aspergillus versicolor CBS 583.65]OJI97934.1 hypothetical protein ASPVEDRAFT_37396 [Aspergillus versicolor CBS 583.65]